MTKRRMVNFNVLTRKNVSCLGAVNLLKKKFDNFNRQKKYVYKNQKYDNYEICLQIAALRMLFSYR